ncbi:cytochrome c3 family protein [Gaetbulibacter saemankumensis]|uniref:cytochrome c3 family protein n=1 Tax=Gaetbulibacter saemankumensis TaxID=311208 RepID=UPI000428923E|nr:cytochrome c3 family protein [Gaetbulibacter saemankumensis]
MEKIQVEGNHYEGTSISSENYLEGLETIEISEGGQTFLIPERKSHIKSFACTECHSKPLAEMQEADIKKAHWDIKIVHANENTMNCVTCHNPSNMDELHSLTGKSIDFNNSYNLCSQCHSKQFEDWKGGAHGKRIGGWAPPRASMTCVNCHNPHQPHFESRWPARFNTQKVKERE